MDTLKVQVKKDTYTKIASGEEKTLSLELTESLVKKVSNDGKWLEDDNSNLKKYDELYISCMFSSNNITIPIKKMVFENGNLLFFFKEDKKEQKIVKKDKKKEEKNTNETEKNTNETEKNTNETEKNINSRISEVIEKFCKNKDVFVVNSPRVIVRPNGVLWGLEKRLPIDNDQSINIDIEKQKFFHTYDISDDMFISQLVDFFKKMLVNNYVFIWKNKCDYKIVDGKRFLVLYYTTRRHIKQNKR